MATVREVRAIFTASARGIKSTLRSISKDLNAMTKGSAGTTKGLDALSKQSAVMQRAMQRTDKQLGKSNRQFTTIGRNAVSVSKQFTTFGNRLNDVNKAAGGTQRPMSAAGRAITAFAKQTQGAGTQATRSARVIGNLGTQSVKAMNDTSRATANAMKGQQSYHKVLNTGQRNVLTSNAALRQQNAYLKDYQSASRAGSQQAQALARQMGAFGTATSTAGQSLQRSSGALRAHIVNTQNAQRQSAALNRTNNDLTRSIAGASQRFQQQNRTLSAYNNQARLAGGQNLQFNRSLTAMGDHVNRTHRQFQQQTRMLQNYQSHLRTSGQQGAVFSRSVTGMGQSLAAMRTGINNTGQSMRSFATTSTGAMNQVGTQAGRIPGFFQRARTSIMQTFSGIRQNVSREMSGVNRSVGSVTQATQNATRSIPAMITRGITMPFRDATAAVRGYAAVLGLLSGGALAKTGMDRLSAIENAQVSLEVMMGDADRASNFLDDVLDFAKTTPFAFPDLAETSRNLVAFGMDEAKVIPTMQAIGDAAAGSGKGAEGLNQISAAFGDIQTSGRLGLDQVNRLATAGVPAIQIFANATGQSLEDTRKAITAGSFESVEAIDILVDGMQNGTSGVAGETAAMAGLMEKMKDTWVGSVDSMKSSISSTMATLLEPAKPHIQDFMGWFGEQFSKLPDLVSRISSGFSPAMGPLKAAFQDIGSFIGNSLIPALQRLGPAIMPVITPLVGIFRVLAAVLKNIIGPVLNFITSWSGFAPVLSGIIAMFLTYKAVVMAVTAVQKVLAIQQAITTLATNSYAIATRKAGVEASLFRKILLTLTVAARKLNLALLANPYVLIAALVIGLGVAIYSAYQNIDWFRNAITSTFQAIKAFGQNLASLGKYFWAIIEDGDTLNDWIMHLPEPWRNAIIAIGQSLSHFRDMVLGVFTTLRDMSEPLILGMQMIFDNFSLFISNVLAGRWQEAFNVLAHMFHLFFLSIDAAVRIGLQAIADIFGMDVMKIRENFIAMLDDWEMPAFMQRMAQNVKDGAGAVKDAGFAVAQSIYQGISDGISSINESASAVTNIGFKLAENLRNGFLSGIASIGESIKSAGGSIAGFFSNGLNTSVGGAFKSFLDTIKFAFSDVSGLISIVAPTFTTLGLAMLGVSGPIGWIAGAIVGLIGMLYRLYNTNDEVRSMIQNAWAGIQSIFGAALTAIQPILDVFREAFAEVGQELGPEFAKTWDVMKQSMADLQPAFEELGSTFQELGTTVAPIVKSLVDIWVEWQKLLWGSIAAIATEILPLLLQAFQQIFTIIGDVVQQVLPIVIDLFTEIISIIGELIATVLPVLAQLIQTIFPIIGQIISTVVTLAVTILKELAGVFSEIVKAVLPALLQIVQTVFPAILTIITTVLPIVAKLIAAVAFVLVKLIMEIVPILLKVFQAVFPAVLSIIQAVLPVVVQLLSIIIQTILQIVQAVLPAFLQVVSAVFPVVLSIIQAVIPIITAILQLLVGIITNVLIPAIEFILKVVQLVFPVIATVIQNALNMVIGILNFFIALFTGNWRGMWDSLKLILSSAFSIIQSVLKLALDLLILIAKSAWNLLVSVTTASFNGLKNFFNVLWSAISNIFRSIIGAIVTVTRALFTGFINGLRAIFSGLQSFFSAYWAGVRSIFTTVISAIVTAARAIFQAWSNTTRSLFNALRSFLSSLWTAIRNTITSTVQTLWNTVKSIYDTWNNITRSIFSAIRSYLSNVWSAVRNAILNVVRALWNGIRTIYNSWNSVTRSIFSAIRNYLSAVWSAIRNTVRNVVQGLWNAIRTIFNTWNSVTRSIFTNVRTFLQVLWTALRDRVVSIVSNLWNRVRNTWNTLRDTTRNLFQRLRDFLVNLWTNLRDRVSTFAQNILSNVRNAWTALRDRTTEMFRNIYNSVRDRFNDIVDMARKLPGRIGDGLRKMAKHAINGGIDVLNGIGSSMKNGLNDIIEGLNSLLEKIGIGSGDLIPKVSIPTISKYARGTDGHPGGPAIVGDGGMSELVQFPTGQTFLSPDTDTLLDMPRGTQVLSGPKTKQAMASMPFYKEGIGSKLWGGIKKGAGMAGDALGSGVDFVKKQGEKVYDWVAEGGSKIVSKVMDGIGFEMPPQGAFFGKFIKGAFNKVKEALAGNMDDKTASFGMSDFSGINFGPAFRRTSGFGRRSSPGGIGSTDHKGVDYAAPMGTPIRSQSSGRVSFAGFRGGLGNNVRIKSGEHEFVYGHNSKNVVSTGQNVSLGQHIANVGSTGNSTGPHVHFEIRKNGRAINPDTAMAQMSGGAGPAGRGVQRWRSSVMRAANQMNVNPTGAQVNAILAQIQRESGGNERIIQSSAVRDINTARGNPARGLLQYIPQTFRAYAMRGHNNIMSGYDQLLAFFNNKTWARDNPGGTRGWGPRGGRRYEKGGIISQEHTALVGEGGKKEAIIPLEQHRSRAVGLWKETGRRLGLSDQSMAILFNSQEGVVHALERIIGLTGEQTRQVMAQHPVLQQMVSGITQTRSALSNQMSEAKQSFLRGFMQASQEQSRQTDELKQDNEQKKHSLISQVAEKAGAVSAEVRKKAENTVAALGDRVGKSAREVIARLTEALNAMGQRIERATSQAISKVEAKVEAAEKKAALAQKAASAKQSARSVGSSSSGSSSGSSTAKKKASGGSSIQARVSALINKGGSNAKKYFDVVRSSGDWLNDWATNLGSKKQQKPYFLAGHAYAKSLGHKLGKYASMHLKRIQGYADGGIVDQAQLAWIAEGGWAESIISHDPAKRARSEMLWKQTGSDLGFAQETAGMTKDEMKQAIIDGFKQMQLIPGDMHLDDEKLGEFALEFVETQQAKNNIKNKVFRGGR